MPKPMPMPTLKTISWCLSQQISALFSETELVNVNVNDKAKPHSIFLCFCSVFHVAAVAQWIEYSARMEEVGCSSPCQPQKFLSSHI